MRVAVTGASGFCGGAVARAAAAAGHDVVCLGRRPGPVGTHRHWDAGTDRPDLAGTDLVIHLAAAVGDPPDSRAAEAAFRRVNVEGTGRLLDAAGGRPVVFVSSASVYAPTVHSGPVSEDASTHGQRNAYGRTKAAADRLALDAGAVVLRPRAVYGPGDPHLLPRLRRAVRAGRLPLPGPDVRMSLTAVENLADACLAAADWPAGAYNVTDARPYPRDASVAAILGAGVTVVHVPVPIAIAAAAMASVVASAVRRTPTLTRYAVDQLTRGMVLDTTRATARGYRPRRTLADFLRTRTTEPTVP